MALRPILTKTARQHTLLLAASLRPIQAKLDRYDAIRTFFSSQAVSRKPSHSTSSSCLREHALTRPLHLSRRVSNSNNAREPPRPPINEDDLTTKTNEANDGTKNETPPQPTNYDNYSPFFRRLAMSLPHLPRHSRDDFLKVATGFWARARIRFKWFTIKSFRPFNADDMSAFITWFVMSQTLWIFVGT